MKKLLSIILTIAVAIGTMQVMVFATSSNPTLSVEIKNDNESVLKGKQFTVAVRIDEPEDLFAFAMHLNYDTEDLTFVSITPNELVKVNEIEDVQNGEISIGCSLKPDEEFKQDLLYITFKCNQEYPDTEITINDDETSLSDLSGNEMEYTPQDMTITQPDKPYFTPTDSKIYSPTKYSIKCNTEDAEIYYSYDENDPYGDWEIYRSGLTIQKSTTIYAVAKKDGVYSAVESKSIKSYISSGSTGGGGGSGSSNTYYPVTTSPVPTATPASANNYSDIQGHWAQSYITNMINKGVINGYEDGTVRPNGTVTRAEATKIMVSSGGKKAATEINLTFTDLDQIPDWAKGWVQQAVDLKIMNGYEDGTFKASQGLTRKEMAVMAMRAYGFGEDTTTALTFADASSIPSWASGYIAKAVSMGIITGYDDNTFRPDQPVTRAEACAIISKCLEKVQ